MRESPIDPKLSDCGVQRGTFVVAERWWRKQVP